MFKNLKIDRRSKWILLSLFLLIVLAGVVLLVAAPVGLVGIVYWITGTEITMGGQNPPTFTISGESPNYIVVAEVEQTGSPNKEGKEGASEKAYWKVYMPPRQITYGDRGDPQTNNPLPLVEGKTYHAFCDANHSSDGFYFIIKDSKAVEVERD
jgi:hypothetical protein